MQVRGTIQYMVCIILLLVNMLTLPQCETHYYNITIKLYDKYDKYMIIQYNIIQINAAVYTTVKSI